jgi:hypothetical protein
MRSNGRVPARGVSRLQWCPAGIMRCDPDTVTKSLLIRWQNQQTASIFPNKVAISILRRHIHRCMNIQKCQRGGEVLGLPPVDGPGGGGKTCRRDGASADVTANRPVGRPPSAPAPPDTDAPDKILRQSVHSCPPATNRYTEAGAERSPIGSFHFSPCHSILKEAGYG